MKTLNIVAGALLLGLGGFASASEPVELDDRALDTVTGGAVAAFASGFTFGTLASGLRGGTSERSAAQVVLQEQTVNGVYSKSLQLGAVSTFTATGIGPGPTSAYGSGGVVLGLL